MSVIEKGILIPVALSLMVTSTMSCGQPTISTGDVTIEYVAHASFKIRSDSGTTVLIDPFASRVWIGYDFPSSAMDHVEAVLITHPHYDHDGGRYRNMDLPWPDTMRIIDSVGAYRIGDISILGVRGKHADPYGMEFGQLNTIWLLQIDELRIVHLGDNGPLTEEVVETLGRVDVLMMPIDDQYHILSETEVQNTLMALQPSVLIPMHYRHDDLEQPDKPEDLGGIDMWISDKADVRRPSTNVETFNVNRLPMQPEIVVLQHGNGVP